MLWAVLIMLVISFICPVSHSISSNWELLALAVETLNPDSDKQEERTNRITGTLQRAIDTREVIDSACTASNDVVLISNWLGCSRYQGGEGQTGNERDVKEGTHCQLESIGRWIQTMRILGFETHLLYDSTGHCVEIFETSKSRKDLINPRFGDLVIKGADS